VFQNIIGLSILSISFITICFSFNNANGLDIYPPDANPYGLTYEQHGINYWKWLLSMSAQENPNKDSTGAKCTNGQVSSNSSVFYLTGSGGGVAQRDCEVPAGKGILIMLSSMGASTKEFPNYSSEELRQAAQIDQDNLQTLYLKIDEKSYSKEDLLKYRKATNEFDIVFPENSLFGVSAGVAKMVTDNTLVITDPIQGTHKIDFGGTLVCTTCPPGEQTTTWNVSYNLTAK